MTAAAMALLGVGVIFMAAGTLILVTTWLFGLPFSLPLLSLGAVWANTGSRIERGLPPSLLSRMLALVAAVVLLLLWWFLADPYYVTLNRQAYGHQRIDNPFGSDRLLAFLLGSSAISIAACMARGQRTVSGGASGASRQ